MNKNLALKIKRVKLIMVSGRADRIYLLTNLPTTQPSIADIAGYETLVLEVCAQEGYGEQWIEENLQVKPEIVENGTVKRRRNNKKKEAK